jgi:amino acid transporter
MLVIGVVEFEWFIEEIAAMFFIMGIIVGVIGGLKIRGVHKKFSFRSKRSSRHSIHNSTGQGNFGNFKRRADN